MSEITELRFLVSYYSGGEIGYNGGVRPSSGRSNVGVPASFEKCDPARDSPGSLRPRTLHLTRIVDR
jgi:hypothetical protein